MARLQEKSMTPVVLQSWKMTRAGVVPEDSRPASWNVCQGFASGQDAGRFCHPKFPTYPGEVLGHLCSFSIWLNVEMTYTFLALRVLSKGWLKESSLFWETWRGGGVWQGFLSAPEATLFPGHLPCARLCVMCIPLHISLVWTKPHEVERMPPIFTDQYPRIQRG